MTTHEIYIDGGCSGNPGPMRIAIVDGKHNIVKETEKGTNNIAEYQALLYALIYIKKEYNKSIKCIRIRSDSNLIVNQFNGNWKCKDATLRKYLDRALEIAAEAKALITVEWIKRSDNPAGHLLESTAPFIIRKG